MEDKYTEGLKFDASKPRFELLSPDALLELARVATKGAEIYGDRNWELGMDWTRILGALYRHTIAWQRGEEFDPETGCHHMAAVMWNAMVLLHFQAHGTGKNNGAFDTKNGSIPNLG